MFSLGLGRKKASLLGIDIGSTAVKLVELSRAGTSSAHAYRVEACAHEPLPPAAIMEKRIADIQAVGAAIRRALAQSGTKIKAAAVAAPASATITKVIPMAADLSDADRLGLIQLDADHHIPYPLDEVNLDFTVLGSSLTPGEVDVLLVATRHEIVDNLLSALGIAGLKAKIVDVEPYALENGCRLALASQVEEQRFALADIGAMATRLTVVGNGRSLYNREIGFAARQLIDQIQLRYDLRPEEAESRLFHHQLPPEFAGDLRGPFAEALAQQIARSLQFLSSSTTAKPADQILLSGGCALLPGLDQVIAQRLGIRTDVVNPFLRMSLASSVDPKLIQEHYAGFTLAAGLALRGFD